MEVDEQDTQSKDNAVTEMYFTVLERFNVALHKVWNMIHSTHCVMTDWFCVYLHCVHLPSMF